MQTLGKEESGYKVLYRGGDHKEVRECNELMFMAALILKQVNT